MFGIDLRAKMAVSWSWHITESWQMTSNNLIINVTIYFSGKKCYEEKVVGGTVCRVRVVKA